MPEYNASEDGEERWNFPENFPTSGDRIIHPADDASTYLYVAMNGVSALDRGNERFDGMFTTSLCGCGGGLLVRIRAGRIQRIVTYHYTTKSSVYDEAVEAFNADGIGEPRLGSSDYLIIPDKAGYAASVPKAFSDLEIPEENVFHYLRSSGEHVSFILSFDGEAGEMSEAFAGSRSGQQKKPWGVQEIQAPPQKRGCCVIL